MFFSQEEINFIEKIPNLFQICQTPKKCDVGNHLYGSGPARRSSEFWDVALSEGFWGIFWATGVTKCVQGVWSLKWYWFTRFENEVHCSIRAFWGTNGASYGLNSDIRKSVKHCESCPTPQDHRWENHKGATPRQTIQILEVCPQMLPITLFNEIKKWMQEKVFLNQVLLPLIQIPGCTALIVKTIKKVATLGVFFRRVVLSL